MNEISSNAQLYKQTNVIISTDIRLQLFVKLESVYSRSAFQAKCTAGVQRTGTNKYLGAIQV